MGNIFEQIGDWIKQGIIDAIRASFTGMFDTSRGIYGMKKPSAKHWTPVPIQNYMLP